jgi:hypothetical protein
MKHIKYTVPFFVIVKHGSLFQEKSFVTFVEKKVKESLISE